jgi:hypothetical protein
LKPLFSSSDLPKSNFVIDSVRITKLVSAHQTLLRFVEFGTILPIPLALFAFSAALLFSGLGPLLLSFGFFL